MQSSNIQIHSTNSKLQEDVDNILAGVHHLFDDIAEYARDNDPGNIVDLDKVLNNRTVTHSAHSKSFPKQSPDTARTHANTFPSKPKKIVNAMPRELQEEVRIYETRISKREEKTGFTKFLFRRLQF